jgi:cysteine desulfurase
MRNDRHIVYLDNNASTPIDPRVLETVHESMRDLYGNPSNPSHAPGRRALESLEAARGLVRKRLDAEECQVIFTSSATEALNAAIIGLQPEVIVVAATEHEAVWETCHWLERERGVQCRLVRVQADGILDLDELERALQPDASLAVVMLANNETGVVNPIERVTAITREKGVPLLCDLTQAIGKLKVSIRALGVDLSVISGHKVYGPRGAGALMFNQTSLAGKLHPFLFGGGQEFGFRAGTENVPAVVGLAQAVDIAADECDAGSIAMQQLRDVFEDRLQEEFPDTIFHGRSAPRLPNTSYFAIPGVSADELLDSCNQLALSRGSACGSQRSATSHVLRAMAAADEIAANSVRMSCGKFNTVDEGIAAATIIAGAVRRIRLR